VYTLLNIGNSTVCMWKDFFFSRTGFGGIERVPRWMDRGVYRIYYTSIHIDDTSSRYRAS
jgi:hypothetical protein